MILLPAGRIVVLEDKLRSHPEATMWSSMCDYLHLCQPTIGTLICLIELISAIHQLAGMAILDQPIVQRKRWYYFMRSILASTQIPLCLGLHLQLNGRVITNLLFGNI